MPNRRTVREGERFKCPYPGCKRSFAELWRLKVHYRAPPDVRGSGKERGHGQELAQCPQCGARLLPGKHHIQCSGARSKRGGEAEKNGKATQNVTAATSTKKYHPCVPMGTTRVSTEQLNGLAQAAAQPGVHVHAQWAGAQVEPGTQQVHAYTHFSQEGPADMSQLAQQFILAPAQHQALQAQHLQQHYTHPQHPAMYGQSHESVQQLPQVLQHMHQQAAPVQYTNTFVREAVPGNPSAAHCSLQTDLCGAVWPLHQPFPLLTSPHLMHSSHPAYTVLTSAQAWGANGSMPVHAANHARAGIHLQPAAMHGHTLSTPSATLADSNLASHSKASHLSTQSTVAALSMHEGMMMPTPEHEVRCVMGGLATAVATSSNQVQQVAENATNLNQQQHPQQQGHPAASFHVEPSAGVYQASVKLELAHESGHPSMQTFVKDPSPPASPPPDLVDLPFDFGKFDELEGGQSSHGYGVVAHSSQSMHADHALNEMDSIFDVPAMTDSEDLLKIFTHDSQGTPMITSHIHQRQAADDRSDHEFEFVANVFRSTMGVDRDGDAGGSIGDCRMVTETESTLGSYVAALGVASPS